MIRIETLEKNENALKPFLDLPYLLHKGDADRIRFTRDYEMQVLLKSDLYGMTQRIFIAYDDDRPVARVVAGVDTQLNRKLGRRNGSVCMFECDTGLDYAFAILDAACAYLKGLGMETVTGPDSPTIGSFSRGILIDGFDKHPYILDSYNDEGYAYYFEKYGFVKHRDYYAYQFNLAMFDVISAGMLSTRAQRRFGFSVSHADLCGNEADKSIRDIAGIIRAACPPKWETSLPDAASLGNEISLLKDLLVPELTVVAYAGDQPIGFLFVLPDYCGSCTGSDTVKNAFYAGNVSAARCCMQFVVPEYRHKAVNIAMFHEAFLTARKYGIRQIEAGQIDETNIPSLNYISRMNAKQTFTWRQYEKKL